MEREGRTDNDGCFKDSDLRQVANGTLFPDRPFFQTILKKLGPSSEDKICPWNPARYLHKKETLILTGGADPVTAGKQAMDFYENGLTPGKRAIIIFPRTGHELQPQMRFESQDGDNKGPSDDTISTEISNKFLNLVDAFVDLTVGQFVEDEGVKDVVDRFGAKMLPCKAELPQKKGHVPHGRPARRAGREDLGGGMKFSLGKFGSFVTAPLLPLVIVLALGRALALGGLIGNLLGGVVLGLLFFIALGLGLAAAFLLVGLSAGGSLMYPTIAVEGSDSFDAVSRSFSYVLNRPWRRASTAWWR